MLHGHNRTTPLLDSDASKAKWSATTYEEAERIAQANDIFTSEYHNDCISYGSVSGDHQASSSLHDIGYFWPDKLDVDDTITDEGTKVYYRDVYVFIDCIKDIIEYKGEELVLRQPSYHVESPKRGFRSVRVWSLSR